MEDTPLFSLYKGPESLKQMSFEQMGELCGALRERILLVVSHNGGHLASNLGVVELTVALHRTFSFPPDQLLWDVSHQTYAHKLLTGRNGKFDTLRQPGGLSGFSKPEESLSDPFSMGHSSTSISVALGLAKAKSITGAPGHVIAVIGDGSFTGGLAYEGLNNAGRTKERLIVVLNDNEHSISPNVGAFARYLTSIRTKPSYFRAKDKVERGISSIPLAGRPLRKLLRKWKSYLKYALYHCTIFEDLGFVYLGPVDGHDLHQLCAVLERAKELEKPVLVHVNTQKGKGYPKAEQIPGLYHAVAPFDLNQGVMIPKHKEQFCSVFVHTLCTMAQQNPRICAITAAMADGTGLSDFAKKFPDRFFDVGIAEEHAVSFAMGLSKNGMIPFFAVYSTFLQRSYDQLIHDLALNRCRCVVAIDRAGLVGEDGETHQGVFDPAFLNPIPGWTVYSPATYGQLRYTMSLALTASGPVAIRYPKGKEGALASQFLSDEEEFCFFPSPISSSTVLVTYGALCQEALSAWQKENKRGRALSLLCLCQIKPVPDGAIKQLKNYRRCFFVEEAVKTGGIGEHIASLLSGAAQPPQCFFRGVPEKFLPADTIAGMRAALGLDADGICAFVEEFL